LLFLGCNDFHEELCRLFLADGYNLPPVIVLLSGNMIPADSFGFFWQMQRSTSWSASSSSSRSGERVFFLDVLLIVVATFLAIS